MDTIIKVENLSKRYRIGLQEKKADTFAQQLWNNLKAPVKNFQRIKSLGKFEEESESVHWALKDVSFEVKQGEVLGIIGKNGAGKSTLLKILSKITEPTLGRIEMNGRVAALLEVGTGFHPELTGRENIYMNGTILGMTKKEIDRKLDEIIDFSGVEKYIDTPVKFYSSGMRVRLGFSVAAHLEPEILIIDEVLAVGDYEFQQKCLGKMEDVSKKEGRTVLFVSHNMQAVSTLTKSAIILQNGKLVFNGETEHSIGTYLSLQKTKSTGFFKEDSKGIISVSLKTSEPNNVHRFNEKLIVEIVVSLSQKVKKPAVSYQVFDEFDNAIFHELFLSSEYEIDLSSDSLKIISEIENLRLYPGSYFLKVHYADNSSKTKLDMLSEICHFNVEVMGELRDYYWQPGVAKYVERGNWKIG
ncbi:polysaccharide ABC transporter ATP-binding protein [uncultured Algoriphagus sp.]|uniref:ABC transporter ATP-binding protein n=1 Tax=uncultured Algoriphagus sp. TaxID=417365 RepID=UPI002590C117|nr:polysaccharide ABC transporter ATP-binding protein [uncultured Algoriphagus sp.]